MKQQTAPRGLPVPRARQSYLFDHRGASPYPSFSTGPHPQSGMDRSIPRDAAIVPPELDPEGPIDPEDPDWIEADPADWPGWTDGVRYAPTRRGGGR